MFQPFYYNFRFVKSNLQSLFVIFTCYTSQTKKKRKYKNSSSVVKFYTHLGIMGHIYFPVEPNHQRLVHPRKKVVPLPLNQPHSTVDASRCRCIMYSILFMYMYSTRTTDFPWFIVLASAYKYMGEILFISIKSSLHIGAIAPSVLSVLWF